MDEHPTHPQGPNAVPSPRSTWPVVLGVIAIVLGAAGVLSGALSAVFTLFANSMISTLPAPARANPEAMAQMEAIRSAVQAWSGLLVGSQLARTAVAAALVAGGILLVQRKRAALRTLNIWAVLQLIVVPVRMAAGYLIIQQAASQMPIPGGGPVLMTVALGFGVLWGWAFPVFMLIWLGRTRIREEVKTWS